MNLMKKSRPNSKVTLKMPCTALPRLIKQYAFATARLSACVAEMSTIAYLDDSTFDPSWFACEEARAFCVQIQEQIYEHLREHRCALDISGMMRGLVRVELAAKTSNLA